jgi:hypothetical protein
MCMCMCMHVCMCACSFFSCTHPLKIIHLGWADLFVGITFLGIWINTY